MDGICTFGDLATSVNDCIYLVGLLKSSRKSERKYASKRIGCAINGLYTLGNLEGEHFAWGAEVNEFVSDLKNKVTAGKYNLAEKFARSYLQELKRNYTQLERVCLV